MKLRSIFRVGLVLTAAFAALGAGAGQPAAEPSQAFDSKEFLARTITRLALIDLRAAPAPTEGDYRLAHLLLASASEINPSDPEILRRKIEAAYACGDDQSVLETTRALLRLDTKSADTVAQLRLITALISERAQTAEERLQVYEQFIADSRIDAAIRSRLALDAALLLRERADDEAFRKKLTLACQLDSSHKEAAALAAAVIAERRPDDAAARFQALQNLLMADPLDPNVHLAISRELVNARAFKAARRFFTNADIINQIANAATERSTIESMVLQMHADGPAALAASMSNQLQMTKDSVAKDLRAAQEAGAPLENVKKPEDVRFGPNSHVLYIMALAASGDANSASATLSDFAAYVELTGKGAMDAVKRGKLDPEQAMKGISDLLVQLELARLLTGLQFDQVRKDLDDNKILIERYPAMFRDVDKWVLLRQGDPDKAIAAFEPDADTNTASLLGIAAAQEAAGRTQQALETYGRILTMAPLDPQGAWARSRLLALGYKEDPGPIAAMETAAARIPRWIDAMATEPGRFVQFRVELSNRDPLALDRTTLRITIENLSDIPLALGSDRPISSRLLLGPKLEATSGGTMNLARPEVAHIDRRLRLMPNETLQVDLWPDPGQCGWLLESLANRSMRVRWRVLQGFQSDRRGGFVPGVMGASTESAASIRRPLPEATLPPAALAKQVSEGPVNLIARIAGIARANLIQPIVMPKIAEAAAPRGAPVPAPAAQPAADEMKPVADAFAARYPNLGPTERSLLVVTLPHAKLAPVMQPVDQVMRAETDPAVLGLVLITRVSDPADELLARCKESDDPRLREIAGLVAQRLAGANPTYARWTPSDIGKAPFPAVEATGVPQ